MSAPRWAVLLGRVDAVCSERAADLSDEILHAIADEEIFAMCRGVEVDADVVEAARAELERRRAAAGE